MRTKIFGTTIEVSFLTVAVMSAIVMLDTSNRFLSCIFCALIHECGHLVTMIAFKVDITSIKFRLFDILIEGKPDRTFLSDLVITINGPCFNFLFALVFYLFDSPMSYMNLIFGVFNLLPVDTFDGGHITSLLLSRKLSFKTIRIIMKVLTFVFLLPIFLVGVLVLFYSRYNYSLLLISLYLVAVLFLK